MDGTTTCSGDFCCSDGSFRYNTISPALYSLPAYAALISSSLSLVGAALNIIAYCAFKDLRKGTAQTIIAMLAIADFLFAMSVMFGASLYLAYDITSNSLLSGNEYHNFDTLCQIQAFTGIWMLGSSITWTSVLALHFFLVTVCTRSTWPHKMMPLYNIVAWLVPLSTALSMLLLGILGTASYLTWTCFVRSSDAQNHSFIQWDVLEVTTAVCILLGYTSVLFSVILKLRRQSLPVRKVTKRMLTFLVVFLLLRVWDMAMIATALTTAANKITLGCSSVHRQTAGFAINTLMAVADPGQGWVNCILYIFLSSELRKRMFVRPFQQVWRKLVEKTTLRLHEELDSPPCLEDSIDPLISVPARRQGGKADGGTHTYLSFPTEFPISNQE